MGRQAGAVLEDILWHQTSLASGAFGEDVHKLQVWFFKPSALISKRYTLQDLKFEG